MSRPLIVNLEPDAYSADARAILETCGEFRERPAASRADLLEAVRDAGVVVTRLSHRLDREVFAAAPGLRAVVTPTTGLNHVDLPEAKERRVEVLSLRGETAFLETITATAELTWALILLLMRPVVEAVAHTRAGGWNRDAFRGRELRGKVLGVVGLGRLGSMVARYGAAFQMQVLAHDPHPARPPEGVELVSLQQLLNRADILTLHASFDDSTRGLIDARALALTKRGVLLVNTARGEILEETALLDALRRGQVAAAALDVLGGEPFADPGALRAHPLWQWAQTHPNLILTPHMGGAAVESMARTEVFMAEKLRKWLNAPAPRS